MHLTAEHGGGNGKRRVEMAHCRGGGQRENMTGDLSLGEGRVGDGEKGHNSHREYEALGRSESARVTSRDLERGYNSQTNRREEMNSLENYNSHKYGALAKSEDKPKITPRQSLKNDSMRPSTLPGAESKEDSRRSEIDRIIQKTLEESANFSKSNSTKSNDSMGKYGASYVEPIDIAPSTGGYGTYRVTKETGNDHARLGSRYGEVSTHVFPQNHMDSSDEESLLRNRTAERFSDANDTFEKFSSLKVSHSPGQSNDKSAAKPKRSSSLKETGTANMNGNATSLSMSPYVNADSLSSVLKETEDILQRSSFAMEASLNNFTFHVGHVKVVIYHGNITAVETAGLVNAANGSLANGAGVAGAIARAASPTMQQECDAYIKKFGILGTGEVMHTRAGGRLSSKVSHILHAVGPIWLEGLPERCTYELTLTYLNVMKYAEKLWLPSITLPCISSG